MPDRVGHTVAMTRAAWLLLGYGVLSGVHVVGQALDATAVTTATKPLLMPVLAAYLLAASARPLSRMTRLVLIALGFSWLGDVLLLGDGEVWFIAGLLGFLLAQITYIVTFVPAVRARPDARPPLPGLVFVLFGTVMVGVLAPDVGALLLPVMVYVAAICTMAVVAPAVNLWTAAGATLFVASDSILALSIFTDRLSGSESLTGVLVMSTYTLAQGLIVHGVVVAQRAPSRIAAPTAPRLK